MRIRWRLRMAAAQREVWTGAELRRLLADRAGLELSSASISALLTKQPSQVKLETLAALCTALDCTPNDLFEVGTTPVSKPASPPGTREPSTPGDGDGRRRAGPDPATVLSAVTATPATTCPACGRIARLYAKGTCRPCYEQVHKRVCQQCGRLAKHQGFGLCKRCRAHLPDRMGTCAACGRSARLYLKGRCRPCYERGRYRPCQQCGRHRRHGGFGLCQVRYGRDPARVATWTARRLARLGTNAPAWLADLTADLTGRGHPSRTIKHLRTVERALLGGAASPAEVVVALRAMPNTQSEHPTTSVSAGQRPSDPFARPPRQGPPRWISCSTAMTGRQWACAGSDHGGVGPDLRRLVRLRQRLRLKRSNCPAPGRGIAPRSSQSNESSMSPAGTPLLG